MKVLLVAPARAPFGELAKLLVRELGHGGIEVRLVEVGDDARAPLALADAFARAREFDLVHALAEPRALPLLFVSGAAAIVTLSPSPTSEEWALAERLAPSSLCVASHEGPARVALAATIAPQSSHAAGAYRALYAELISREAARRVDHVHDRRPWGEYWVLADHAAFKVKRIDVLPKKRLSYQKHQRRAEHWIVVRGEAKVTLDGRDVVLARGATIDIPVGAAHRIENVGDEMLTFVEIQSGTYFGEDDIVRLEDDFGRAR
jgi:mannose-6-phosphate isomerase